MRVNGADMTASELLTLSEAASALRLKVSTLRAWVLRRKLPYLKIGRLVRVRRTDLDALITASVVPARPIPDCKGVRL
jgi:excisionase family DNA binding protein